MLLVRICHLIALPNLQQILLNKNEVENSIAQKVSETHDEKESELVNEIMRNFEGARVAN